VKRPFLVRHQVSCQAGLHRRYQLESRSASRVNPFCQHSLHSVGHTDKLIDYSKRITSFETLEKKMVTPKLFVWEKSDLGINEWGRWNISQGNPMG
jgi:hypothetical protein